MFHKHSLLLELFDDPRLHSIACQLLRCGDSSALPLRFLGDEYVSYSTGAGWHPDMGREKPFESLKFGFYLDPVEWEGQQHCGLSVRPHCDYTNTRRPFCH